MDKSIFDKYIAEMKAMQAFAMPSNEPKPIVNNDILAKELKSAVNAPDMIGSGNIVVVATAIRGLYPVENAKVTIFTGSGEDELILAEQYTNRSGKTAPIPLPAPSSSFTDAPNPIERPYAYYNVRTSADGYIETVNYNVAVFDNTTSLQNVSMYPLTSEPEKNKPIIIDEFESYEL
ncbi:MAG: hypothetical protein IIX54_06655 [Clostridia bacterium]|nr:hypothetical protein [Clostridia bacterium]